MRVPDCSAGFDVESFSAEAEGAAERRRVSLPEFAALANAPKRVERFNTARCVRERAHVRRAWFGALESVMTALGGRVRPAQPLPVTRHFTCSRCR